MEHRPFVRTTSALTSAMSKDVKSKDVKKKTELEKKAPVPPPKPLTPLETLHAHIFLLEKFVDTRDSRFLTRVLRYMSHVRSTLPTEELRSAIQTFVLDSARSEALLDLLALVSPKRVLPAPVKVR